MLESLSQRIEDNIPHAVENPMPWPDLDYYWSSVVRDYPIISEYEWIKKEYEKASVSFTYIELSRLSPAEFLLLQQQLNSVITSSIQKGGVSIPEEVIGFLKPGDKKNILIHEIEHLKELPKIVRSQAKVDIVIYKDLTDQVTIDGIKGNQVAYSGGSLARIWSLGGYCPNGV